MKNTIIFLALLFSSCSKIQNKKEEESKGIPYASLSRSGEIDSLTGFPKFEVYYCLYCNPDRSYDSQLSKKYKSLTDSMQFYKTDISRIEVFEKRADSILTQWHRVRNAMDALPR